MRNTAEKKDKMLEAYLLHKKSQKARRKETNQNADRVGFIFKCHLTAATEQNRIFTGK